METIETIHDNLVTLSHAHIDWSLDGGVVWLLFMVVVPLVGVTFASWSK